ncbi:MAG: 30S ribosomal protein S5 [Phycisphaerales bacterium]|nr:30S ribosomal protein S5 [Phycisphaerales bacterium]
MTEIIDQSSHIESNTVAVLRSSATVKGGRRFQFGALVIVGDRKGRVGMGYAKSPEVPSAVEKAQKYAKRDMRSMPIMGGTIPHEVEGAYSSSKVRLIPAAPGTGVVAGGTVRAILEIAGVTDCLTKCYGSTNKKNVVKAVFEGLSKLRPGATVGNLRGQNLGATVIESKIERGKKFMPVASKGPKVKGPVNTVGDDRKGRGGRGRPRRDRGGEGGGGGGSGGGEAQPAPAPKA